MKSRESTSLHLHRNRSIFYLFKKRLIGFISLTLLFTMHLSAQEKQVEKIMKLYDEFNSHSPKAGEEETVFDVTKYTITNEKIIRAIGTVSTILKVYYDNHEEILETEESADFVYTGIIRKVVSIDRMTGSIYKEYFFDEKGALVYFYLREEQWMFFEEWDYFFNDTLITVVRAGLPDSNKGASADFSRAESNLSQDDYRNAARIMNSANAYKSLFRSLHATLDASPSYY